MFTSIGATGTGSPTLLLSMMLDDAAAGRGLALFDPHGDLAEEFLARLPSAAGKDVILFDPSDADHVLGWNMLAAASEAERDILADDFRRNLQAALDVLGRPNDGGTLGMPSLPSCTRSASGTLEDLRKFLVDAAFRGEFLKTVTDLRTASILEGGISASPSVSGRRRRSSRGSTRSFAPGSIRRIVSETKAQIDFTALVDEGRIFVAPARAGGDRGGECRALGFALGLEVPPRDTRAAWPAAGRPPALPPLSRRIPAPRDAVHGSTCSRARESSASRLTVAHQNIGQLMKRAPETADAVLSEAYTRIAFRVGSDDARTLAKSFCVLHPRGPHRTSRSARPW